MTDPRRRLLFRRGRRQRAAGAAGDAARTRRKARSTSGPTPRSTRCSATTPRSSRRRFGIEPDGNAPQDPQGEFTGKNLLYIAQSIDDIAARTGTHGRRGRRRRSAARALALFDARASAAAAAPRRQGPHGLERPDDRRVRARGARACRHAPRAGAVSRRPRDAPRRSSATHLWHAEQARLLRRYRDGEAAIDGYAEDYA